MKIGLLSDTHNFLDPRIWDYLEEADELWHAGDIGSVQLLEELQAKKKTRAVWGNIDPPAVRAKTDEVIQFRFNAVDILMIHIAGRPGKYTRQVVELINTNQPDLLICGHSHICRVGHDPDYPGMLYMNPGAAGKAGFHKVRTLIRFDLTAKIENVQVVELGRR